MDRLDVVRGVLIFFIAASGIALIVAASTSTAAFGIYNFAWDGVSDLRSQADAVGTSSETITDTDRYTQVSPNETVAVVLSPATPYNQAELNQLRSFVQRGGTIIIADDFGNYSNSLLQGLGTQARLDGVLVRDERYHYRSSALPVANNVSVHPFLDGVDSLTLNYGTVIHPNNATVLVRTSGYSYLDVNRNEEPDTNESLQAYPVVTVEQVGQGQVIVLSDPSAVINAMLDRSGNQVFVRNVFTAHDRVLLDYSHAEQLPPLTAAILTVRQSLLLQILLGTGGIAIILVLGNRRLTSWMNSIVSRDHPTFETVNQDDLMEIIERRHPDWSTERVRRLTQRIRPQDNNTDQDNDGSE